ncbi:MAG: hypothetical protein ACPGVY_16715 [Mycobacterium sp.]
MTTSEPTTRPPLSVASLINELLSADEGQTVGELLQTPTLEAMLVEFQAQTEAALRGGEQPGTVVFYDHRGRCMRGTAEPASVSVMFDHHGAITLTDVVVR